MSEFSNDTYRILDANINRAGEGLRTMEEYARFICNDSNLTGELKSIRHRLTEALKPLDRGLLLTARNTSGDVGTTLTTDGELERADLAAVVASAANRTTQSLRVLEEYIKTLLPASAREMEQVRYSAYTLFGQLELKASVHNRLERLTAAQIYVLISAGESDEIFASRVKQLAAGGADILQLRDRKCDDRTLYQRALVGSRVATEHGALFIVNDRADLAAAAEADGVHVGQEELPGPAARSVLGPSKLVGISTHDLTQVHQAIADGADYIGCGPVFAGKTKCFDEYVGPGFLRQVHDAPKQRALPAFAIGGIGLENVSQVANAGFHRIAVTGAVRDASDPTSVMAQLRNQLSPT